MFPLEVANIRDMTEVEYIGNKSLVLIIST